MRLLLIKIGIAMEVVEWTMGCLESTSFAVIINGSASKFFRPTRGLRQGCPLSPFIFLLVAEALSRIIHKAKADGVIKGIKVSTTEEVTHTLFVDDVLLFGERSIKNLEAFLALIDKHRRATGMVVNVEKSNLIHNEFPKEMIQRTKELIQYQTTFVEVGFKYLGFTLKPNCYSFQDWVWLYKKLRAE